MKFLTMIAVAFGLAAFACPADAGEKYKYKAKEKEKFKARGGLLSGLCGGKSSGAAGLAVVGVSAAPCSYSSYLAAPACTTTSTAVVTQTTTTTTESKPVVVTEVKPSTIQLHLKVIPAPGVTLPPLVLGTPIFEVGPQPAQLPAPPRR